MAVLLYVDWVNGSYSSPTYTAATPDIPTGKVWTKTGAGFSIAVDNDAPWSGQTCVFITDANNDNINTTVTSSEVATSGRFRVEAEGGGTVSLRPWLYIQATTSNDGQIIIWPSGANLNVRFRWSGASKEATVDLGTYPTGVFNVEVIYDPQNATESLRLRARTWALGGSAPSFTDTGSTTGTSVAMSQPTLVQLGDNVDVQNGRLIVSNDIAQDLSSWSPSTNISVGRGTDTITTYAPLVNPQTARAVSDTATSGNWTPSSGGNRYAMIDELARSDADYIQSGVNPTADACIMKLQTITDPATDNGFHVQWAAGTVGATGTVTGSVRQGNSPGTEIASWVHSGLPVGSFREFDDPVTSAQAANITDYADLYLKLVAS